MSAFLHIEEFKLSHFFKMFAVHPLNLPECLLIQLFTTKGSFSSIASFLKIDCKSIFVICSVNCFSRKLLC